MADKDPSLVERWLGDQQQWQRTILAYLDSMAKNEDFLVHLGNAMRGSLLAGKPYPTAGTPSASVPETADGERLDQLHYAVHQIEGQLQDMRMTLDELRQALIDRAAPVMKPVVKKTAPPRAKSSRHAKPSRQRTVKAASPARSRAS